MVSDVEKELISIIQGDMPVTERPYQAIADQMGISEAECLDLMKQLNEKNLIRRFGATLRHQKSGFAANAMVAWQVPEADVDRVGQIMAGFKAVTHCYRRNPQPTWPYNVYTMVHARDPASCRGIVREISEATGVATYELLFSKKELKKTSMQYFRERIES
ncbi:MAG: AsnC family protein [Deltaproteobacteria bacterium]|nr:MAG: AsnC family protein [Deltaproteobacteria bacterium]